MKFVENNFDSGNLYSNVGKSDQINVRVKPDLKADLEAIADFHGLTVSSYIHSVLTRQVRIEREAMPSLFERRIEGTPAPIVARIEPSEETRLLNETRQRFRQGIPLATNSKRLMPLKKEEKTDTEAKRKKHG